MKAVLLAFLLPLSALAAGKIIDADIAASGTANIARNKLAAGANYAWCVNDSSGFEAGTAVTASRAVATDSNGAPVASATTAAELAFVNGVTSAIQTQLNAKQATLSTSAAVSNQFLTAFTAPNTFSRAQPSASNLSDGTTGSGGAVVLATGPTLSSPIVGTQAASDNSTKAASTAYVTAALNQLNPAAAVVAASTANIAGTYTNAVGGVCIGDTFQVTSTAAFSPDGVTLTVGQRFLMKDQTSTFQDGVWTLTTAANIGVLGALLTRALDMDSSADLNAGQIVPVSGGTVNAGTSWYQTANVTTCNSDSQTWTQFQKASSAYASSTLTSAHLHVGNSSNVATDVAAGGDLSLDNTGAFTIGAGAVTNSKIANAAGIYLSKIQPVTGSVALASTSAGAVTGSITTTTELGYVSGTTGSIQSQLNSIPKSAITALTGDGTANGPGSSALTLATVNSNVGTFTNSTITVNAKGLVTAASTGASSTPTGAVATLLAGTGVGNTAAYTTASYPLTATSGSIMVSTATNAFSQVAVADDNFILATSNSKPVWVVPKITNWAPLSPHDLTFAGQGTTSSQATYYRRVGDTAYVRGQFTSGTVAASNCNILLPGELKIDTTKMPSSNTGTAVGFMVTPASGGATNAMANGAILTIFYDGSTATNLYITYETGGNKYTQLNCSTMFNNNAPNTYSFEIPVSGWSANVNSP